jgi:hypothetical protein
MAGFTPIGNRRIYHDETYFVAYAGGKRELPSKEQKEYNNILRLPFLLQRKELKKLGFENNPNVIPIKGVKLIEVFKVSNFLPLFDHFFDQSRLLTVTDEIVYESIRQKNYEIALG